MTALPMTALTQALPENLFKTLPGIPEGQDALALKERAIDAQRKGAVALHIALDDARMATLADLLAFFAPDIEVLTFPAWDCLPYDRVSPSADIIGRRVATLSALAARQKSDIRKALIVLTSVNAAVQRVVPVSHMQAQNFTVTRNMRLDAGALVSALADQGYVRTDVVREGGEFAVRGGIIDIFVPGHDNPVRIDLFGDEVESLKTFDAMSQRSLGAIDSLSFQGVAEVQLNDENIQRFRKNYRDLFGVIKDDPLYETISEGRRYGGMEHWLPLFHGHLDTLFDYMPNAFLSADQQMPQARVERLAQANDLYQARLSMLASKTQAQGGTYRPAPMAGFFLDDAEWTAALADMQDNVLFSPFGDGPAKRGRDFLDVRSAQGAKLFNEVGAHIAALQAAKKTVLLASYSAGARDRIKGLLHDAGFDRAVICNTHDEIKKLDKNQAGLVLLALENGFANENIAVITEQDMLGDRLARKTRGGRRKADAFLREVSSLNEGDLVVHIDHGVGKFEGLETLRVGDTLHDCLKISYDGGDRLFVPVENIEVLSRFGADEGSVPLDKLGGAGWQARKARVKKNLLEMAGKLLEIAAARALKTADTYDADAVPYAEFAARFPYAETEDQQRSINDIITDLGEGRPMDRLVCGDVGFGKTEVALRAAFVVAMSGAQVAVIVPTTLLARQHAENFTRRFAGFPLRIAQLSRFVTPKEARLVKDELASGGINIVIGTHSLLASGIKFSNLGLVIVDEEQHFGVKQKEKLKDLRKDVHVLTLTATPIPRTLQMALTGVRDLSLITTPPVDRLAVRTFVGPYDPLIIREAILREHYRGGQSFWVVPRIKDLQKIESHVRELVPEVKVVTAHGQMAPGDLEERMTAFYERQYEVLLATNIIESGLDVPTANTLIVTHADQFGLSQLYQIRGRVGRSKVRAFAYLTYENDKLLTATAQKRLEVISMLDTLGSGFQLASHDMDIRGAGNLLGEQQSGHVREVGVELYQQMLEEAVASAKEGVGLDGETLAEAWSPSITLGVSVLIPENYVADLNVRMSLYRRLAELREERDVEAFAAELIDRFGPIPDEVENLLKLTAIKILCRVAGVESIEAGPKAVIVAFRNGTPPNPQRVVGMIAAKTGTVKLRPADSKLVYTRAFTSDNQKFTGVKAIALELASLAS